MIWYEYKNAKRFADGICDLCGERLWKDLGALKIISSTDTKDPKWMCLPCGKGLKKKRMVGCIYEFDDTSTGEDIAHLYRLQKDR